ncbi:hypothetical protein [Streptomyces sp. NPDC059979]|uniref:hypothetical protein n=1 Tax=Streptomyces sp. NPDC059979 TaxID=3347021 RepID=UPI0036BADC1C
MNVERAGVSARRCCDFNPDERAALDSGFARILAAKEAREWETAVREAVPALVRAAAEAVELEASADD